MDADVNDDTDAEEDVFAIDINIWCDYIFEENISSKNMYT